MRLMQRIQAITVITELSHTFCIAVRNTIPDSLPIGFAASQLCDVVQCVHNFN